jgi:Na+/H+-translocating membrane pyrophosphatase
MERSIQVAVRIAEAAKTGVVNAYKLNYNFSLASTFLTAGTGFLIFGVVYFVFKDPAALLALALSAILSSFFSWRGGRFNYLGVFVTTLSAIVVLASQNVSTYSNAEIFPLIFIVFVLLSTAIGAIISQVMLKTENIKSAIYRGLICVSVLVFAGSYFGIKYILVSTDSTISIKLAIAILVGLLLALAVILIRQISKISPILAVGVLVLVSNFLAGNYGITFAAIGFLSLWPAIMILNLFRHQSESANSIGLSAEMSAETLENLKSLEKNKLKSGGYFISLFGISALGLLLHYYLQFSAINFSAADSKFLSGLLFGGTLAYLLNSELVKDKIFKIAIAVLGAIIAGITLGPILLAGVLAGAFLVDLLVSQAIGAEILLMIATSVLLSGFIENQYSLIIRAIIAGAVVLLTAGYFIIEKFYGKRIEIGK